MQLGIIGCGKMGDALLGGVLDSQIVAAPDVHAFDAHAPTLESCADHRGVVAASDVAEVFGKSSVVLLCVKPGDVPGVLSAAGEAAADTLLVSIAAGVTVKALEEGTDGLARVVRVMPNTPALIGMGASAFAPGSGATEDDRDVVVKLLSSVGRVIQVKEPLLDTVTGLSGSGPAYILTIIEALADGGVLKGLSRADAILLAAQTVAGAAEMVLQTGKHPAELRDAVTSPGGTTIAGLAALEAGGLRSALIDAVAKATERSVELGED